MGLGQFKHEKRTEDLCPSPVRSPHGVNTEIFQPGNRKLQIRRLQTSVRLKDSRRGRIFALSRASRPKAAFYPAFNILGLEKEKGALVYGAPGSFSTTAPEPVGAHRLVWVCKHRRHIRSTLWTEHSLSARYHPAKGHLLHLAPGSRAK